MLNRSVRCVVICRKMFRKGILIDWMVNKRVYRWSLHWENYDLVDSHPGFGELKVVRMSN